LAKRETAKKGAAAGAKKSAAKTETAKAGVKKGAAGKKSVAVKKTASGKSAPLTAKKAAAADGKTLVIKYLGLGDRNEEGMRTVHFQLNGARREILPGRVTVAPEHYGKYPILRSDLRGVGLTHVSLPEEHTEEAVELARAACEALNCTDHVRIDMREDASGRLRIMEVNGIPGLKPVKSWSPQIYALYHPGPDVYTALIDAIVSSALANIYR